MATLVINDGSVNDRQFALENHPLLMIGRSEDCTFQVLDSHVSRKHLQLRLDAETGRHQAINYSKSGESYVNGKAISEPTDLSDGDQIRIGDTTMIYSEVDRTKAQTAKEAWFKKGQELKTWTGARDEPAARDDKPRGT